MTKWVLSFILFCVFTSGNLQEKQSSNSIANLLFNDTCTEEWILHKLPIWILSSLKLCIIRGAAALGGREVQLSTCKPSSQLIQVGPLDLFCRVVVFLRILMQCKKNVFAMQLIIQTNLPTTLNSHVCFVLYQQNKLWLREWNFNVLDQKLLYNYNK